MTAIESLKIDLQRVQRKMNEYITEEGYVKQEFRYEYNQLIKEANDLNFAIEYLSNRFNKGNIYRYNAF